MGPYCDLNKIPETTDIIVRLMQSNPEVSSQLINWEDLTGQIATQLGLRKKDVSRDQVRNIWRRIKRNIESQNSFRAMTRGENRRSSKVKTPFQIFF